MIMADRMITTYLDERKYDALKRALNEKGEDFEDTMHDLVAHLSAYQLRVSGERGKG